MQQVAGAPYEHLEKIKSRDEYKVRVGHYRIIVSLKNPEREVHVLTIRHRRNAYKD
ncbi:MAG: type II toxin-antitoxin system RelE/ParE family toxin [DPANN group archaeon]|nr:type II toxin-antitoxin system RelE/ParE family toxin [DPANN group archaeon]